LRASPVRLRSEPMPETEVDAEALKLTPYDGKSR
jgi:hypothetical protein